MLATPTQLATWSGVTAPANAAQLLRSAEFLVLRATLTARYDAEDPAALAALADATCSQVTTWMALAVDPAKGAADPGSTVSAKSLGSGSVQYAVSPAAAQARANAATSLSQEALLILAQAGLVGPQL